jgi:hypothetical protein
MSLDYKKDMYIDHNSLEVEWKLQPELAMKYGEHYALVQDKYTLAEEKVKWRRSVLVADAWKNPDKCLGTGIKAADQKVEAYYRTHPKYVKAKKKWAKLKLELSIAETAKWEIGNRKIALENLVILHGQHYFAGPQQPHDFGKKMKEFEKERNARMGKKLNKKEK